ncbi:elongation factor EF-2 [Candidatus Pacearchaeota archaeon]|nr:elongation factor EF-2 [Candidatus Pacearchaeota archaeon]
MAQEEKKAQKIERLTNNQETIRNICTSAHIHHGKCISGDSRVMLSDGSAITAREVYEEVAKNGKRYEDNEEHTVFIPRDKITIFSLNKETGSIEKKLVQYVWRLKGGNTIKTTLRNGFEISTTPEHKYIIFESMKFTEKPACELKINDLIVCARNIDFFWKEKKANKEYYNYNKIEIDNGNGQKLIQLLKNPYNDLAFVEVKKIEAGFEEVVYDFTIPETHNFIAEGMVICNTAFTDNLLAAAGMMAAKSAGDLEAGMATWQHSDEQERLMTVDAANVSMVHDFHGKEYLINLIDTPGHVDFSGNVTRAMRAIDGTIVLVCASEGIMPQTETVLKQALRERVKPILFINKVDRLIKELKMTPEQMQERFIKIYKDFNKLIERIAEPEYKEKWQVDINEGSVAFGSARDNWALSLPFMKKKGVTFKNIFELYSMDEEQRKEWTWKNAPLFEVILDMSIKHLPNPIEAQKYRIPKIWHGDLESEFGKSLLNCDPKGELAFIITRIVIDPRSGKEISAGRLFSGSLEPGMEVYLNNEKKNQRVQQVLVYNGIKPEQVEHIPAGNVLAIAGIVGDVGETITLKPETPFEEIKHIFEPVITKAIEPKKMVDLPKLVEVLRKVVKEDPSLKVEINEETGENLVSGMGELHLEIIENRITTEKGLEIKTSPPIVVYRETVVRKSKVQEGKSPNKHNSFFITVEPLEDEVYDAIKKGEISERRYKKRDDTMFKKLSELGISNDEIRNVRDVYKGCVFLDDTRGEVHMIEVIDLVLDAFEQVIDAGPLAREPCMKMKLRLADIKLHEDAIHRGPAQVYPAIRDSISSAMRDAAISLFEPLQVHLIEAPSEYMSTVTKLVSSKRGQLIDVQQDEVGVKVTAKLPVAEMLGWSSDLRSATEGRGVSSLEDQSFEKMPTELQSEAVRKIRNRKGLAENQ